MASLARRLRRISTRVALAVGAAPGVLAWLTPPMWLPASGHDFARQSAPPGIDLAPGRAVNGHRALRRLRRGAGWLHLALAVTIVIAVFVQVYLIGSYVFGAGQGALDAHKSLGLTTHGLEGALFVAAVVAWLSRGDLILSLLLFMVGTVQITLADAHKWAGGLHPLGALFVLVLATLLARRDLHSIRTHEHHEHTNR